jgi:hypothetical protein
MATIPVTNSTGYNQYNKAKAQKVEIAYGTISSYKYALGDTLKFTDLDAKEIPYAKFVAGSGESLEIFGSTDLSSALAWNIATAVDISYVIHYVKGGAVNLQITVS